VRVRLAVSEVDIEIAVHNDGVIADDVRKSLFDPFVSSGGKGQRGKEGLGLGLYIVDQIVRAHDGRIDVHSTASEGTTFTVRVPREETKVALAKRDVGAEEVAAR
jgi:signal transduction histidine kinase